MPHGGNNRDEDALPKEAATAENELSASQLNLEGSVTWGCEVTLFLEK